MTNPSNIVRLHSRNSGFASVYEANMWAQAFAMGLFQGNGVKQNTVPDMNVLVGGTTSKPDIILGQNPSGYNIALDIIGQQPVIITAPATNSRISCIVAYTDDLSLNSTDTGTTGSPSKCGLIVVNGTTSATPVAPSDSQIRTAITSDGATGSQAVYSIIASIQVASTTTAITDTLIVMSRATILANSISDGSIPTSKLVAGASGAGYVELGRSILSTAGDTISVTGLPAMKYLKVEAVALNSGSVQPGFRFNGDSSGNYSRNSSGENGGTWSSGAPETSFLVAGSVAALHFVQFEVINIANQFKIGSAVATRASSGASQPPANRTTNFQWSNNSVQINRVDMVNIGTGDFLAGSELIVFGKN